MARIKSEYEQLVAQNASLKVIPFFLSRTWFFVHLYNLFEETCSITTGFHRRDLGKLVERKTRVAVGRSNEQVTTRLSNRVDGSDLTCAREGKWLIFMQ